MPMFEVTAPQGALGQAERDTLMKRTAEAVLIRVGAPVDDPSVAIWSYYHEVPQACLYVGRATAQRPTFKFDITTPEGVLNDDTRARLVADIAAIVGEVIGPSGSGRNHWVLLREIKDGGWGVGGRIFTLADIAASTRKVG